MKSIFSAPARALTWCRSHLDDALVVVGFGLVAYGLAQVYAPLAPIAVGVALIGLVRLGDG